MENKFFAPFKSLSWQEKMDYVNTYANFARLYGIRLVDFAKGYAALTMTISPQHWNSQKRLHGGWSAGLAVIASEYASWSYGHNVQVTSLSINYYKGVAQGELLITAREKHFDGLFMVFDIEINTNDQEHILVAGATVSVLCLPVDIEWHLQPQPSYPREQARPLPVWPKRQYALDQEVLGLRPSFKRSDWGGKMEYLNETENFYYTEDIRLTHYEAGRACIEFAPLKKQHMGPDGNLDPAWVAILVDQLIGKASLYNGEFNVTAQTSINFYEIENQECKAGDKILGRSAGEKPQRCFQPV